MTTEQQEVSNTLKKSHGSDQSVPTAVRIYNLFVLEPAERAKAVAVGWDTRCRSE